MKTKLLSILLATIMFVSLLPTTAFAGGEAPEACDHETWTKWGVDAPEKKSLPSSAGSYYLTDDVTLSGTWTVPSGTVNLCLNGYVIKQTVESSVICVPEGAELNIYDCSLTTHTFKDGDGGLWVLDDTLTGDAVKHTVTGGIITGGKNTPQHPRPEDPSYDAGAIEIGGGFLTMHGGNIVGNKGIAGGGVNLNSGSFTMYDGSIAGNIGGGVYCADAFTMKGGSIKNNVATRGGGLYMITVNSVADLKGGEIINNYASIEGGGIYMNGNGTLKFRGVNISGNTAGENGGGVSAWFSGDIGTTEKHALYFGGSTIINGNTLSSGAASNLYLEGNNKTRIALMTGVDAPDADMCIGISTKTAPTANSLVTISDASDTDYHTSFFADKAMKEDVIYDSSTNKLMLAVPQIAITQTGTNPTYGTAMIADEDFFTVTVTGFGTEPSPKLEWKHGSGETVTWDENAPEGITASLENKQISIATSNTLNAGEYNFRVTNGEPETILDPNDNTKTIANPKFVSCEGTLKVEKATTTLNHLSVTLPTSLVYDGNGKTAIARGASGIIGLGQPTVKYMKDSESTPTDTAPVNAGTYKVLVSVAEGSNFNAASGLTSDSWTFEITKAVPTVTAPIAIHSLSYNDSEHALITAGTTDHGTMQYKLGEGGTYSTEIPTAKNAGEYTVYYKVIGDEHYADTEEASVEATIGKRLVTVSAITIADKIYNAKTDDAVVASYAFDGKLDGDELTLTGVSGTYASAAVSEAQTVTLNEASGWTLGGAARNNYVLASEGQLTTASGKISAFDLSGSTVALDPASEVYTGSAIEPNAVVSFDGANQIPAEDYEISYTNNVNAGTGTVTVSAKTGNVTGSKDASFTIVKRPATITVNNLRVYIGDRAPNLAALGANAYTVEGLVGADTLTTEPTLAYEPAPDMSTAGTYAIVASGAAAANYEITYIPGTLTVTRRNNHKEDTPVEPVQPDKPVKPVCPKDGTCPMSKFADLDINEWYHDGVHYCLDHAIMNGVGNARFVPAGTATRAQIAMVLYNLEGQPAFMNDNVFEDVAKGSWYEKAVTWAQGKGIVEGYGNGRFGPDNPITREQMAVILYNYAKYKEIDVSVDENTNFLSFNDFRDISEWAKPAMMWAIDHKMIVGSNNNLKPQDNAARSQIATIIWRYCENVIK